MQKGERGECGLFSTIAGEGEANCNSSTSADPPRPGGVIFSASSGHLLCLCPSITLAQRSVHSSADCSAALLFLTADFWWWYDVCSHAHLVAAHLLLSALSIAQRSHVSSIGCLSSSFPLFCPRLLLFSSTAGCHILRSQCVSCSLEYSNLLSSSLALPPLCWQDLQTACQSGQRK